MGERKTKKLLLVCAVLVVLAGWLASTSLQAFQHGHWLTMAVSGWVGCVVLMLALIVCDMLRLHPADSHGWLSMLDQYLIVGPLKYYGQYLLTKVPMLGENKVEVQRNVLMELLRRKENTLYGKDHGLSQIHSVEDFLSTQPLTNYSHYEQYVNKIVEEGKSDVLLKGDPIHIALTSGTTGKNKRFPIYQHGYYLRYRDAFIQAQYTSVKNNLGLRRQTMLYYKPSVTFSKTGIPIAPISYWSILHHMRPSYLSPREAHHLTGERDALYVHAVFALREEELGLIDGLMAFIVYSFFDVVEKNHAQLCDDIEKGTLSSHLDIPEDIRESLTKNLAPSPHRAAFLREEFVKGFQHIAPRVWPHLHAVQMISTGGFAPLTRVIQTTYLGPDICVTNGFHGASEGPVSIKMDPHAANDDLVLLPTMAFFEFIKESEVDEKNPSTYQLHQLEVGELYEVVLTNAFLCRYRLGDVIKITGFQAGCPTNQFQYRLGQMLNLCWEKTPESVFYEGLRDTVSAWPGVQLIDYTAIENIVYEAMESKIKGYSKYYVLFLELHKDNTDFILTEEQKEKFDVSLRRQFELYNTLRGGATIDPMQVVQIRCGGFLQLKLHMTRDSGNAQFKMPRVLHNQDQLEFLLQHRVASQTHADDGAGQTHPEEDAAQSIIKDAVKDLPAPPCTDQEEEYTHQAPPDKGYSLLHDAMELREAK